VVSLSKRSAADQRRREESERIIREFEVSQIQWRAAVAARDGRVA
jgi:hypothetical protein